MTVNSTLLGHWQDVGLPHRWWELAARDVCPLGFSASVLADGEHAGDVLFILLVHGSEFVRCQGSAANL